MNKETNKKRRNERNFDISNKSSNQMEAADEMTYAKATAKNETDRKRKK